MIQIENNVTAMINDKDTHLIEMSGLPDAGSSVASVYLLSQLEGLSLYMGHRRSSSSLELFKRVLSDENKRRISFYLFSDFDAVETILEDLSHVGQYLDYVVIDDIAYFILHKKRAFIKSFFSRLYSKALELDIKIIVINQLRYDLYSQDSNQNQYRTLYADYLQSYIDLKLNVTRSETKEEDITVNTEKVTNKSKYRASSVIQDLKSLLLDNQASVVR